MPTRLRIVLAMLVPSLVAVAAALVWTAWAGDRQAQDLSRVAATAGQGQAVTAAITNLSQEIGYAIVQGRVPAAEVPPELEPYTAAGRTLMSAGQGGTLAGLMRSADEKGPDALDGLRAVGVEVTPALAEVLQPMPAAVWDAVASGRAAGRVDWKPYADAMGTLQGLFAAAAPRSQAAIEELVRRRGDPPVWRTPQFLALAIGLLAAVAVCATLIGLAAGRRLSRAEAARAAEEERADALAHRNQHLLAMVESTRRVTAGSDLGSVTGAVVEEARDLLAADTAVVYLMSDDDAAAVPAAACGALTPAVIPTGAGVVGRAIESATSGRAVVVGDPAFPETGGAVSLVVAPLVAGRRVTGALVVANPGEGLMDDDDKLTAGLVALLAGTAIEAARAHDSAAELANTDALTGLANRRRLDGDLAGLSGAVDDRGVAFLMIDVDHFKAYNDANGHPAGDALLKGVADIIRGCVRDSDVVYRFGGEEFAVLLRGANDLEAQAVASRIRAAVAAEAFTGAASQPGGKVTVSIGVSRRDAVCDAAELLDSADGALYRAKREGRDRVVFSAA